MPLKLTCPRCQAGVPLDEPYPLPGDAVSCTSCGSGLAVTYPDEVFEKLKARGKTFAPESPAAPPTVPRASTPPAPTPPPAQAPQPLHAAVPPVIADPQDAQTEAFTEAGSTEQGTASTSDGVDPAPATPATEAPSSGKTVSKTTATSSSRGRKFGCLGGLLGTGLTALAAAAVLGLIVAGSGYAYYSQELPTVETLRAYQPPTVTVVTDTHGEILGEIFDQRRYVVPVDEIPDHVKHAFLAAEDANFFSHGGIDYMGIVRAMGRNALAGRMAQGASTITQQVARNFLLTRDKKLERKIKEAILSWRIESAYDKDHILFLYLNEIFLGSQSYGVEAASRAYFGKSVRDISVAEAAILAGLPQRPSDYSPHRHWSKARARQEYVVGQMEAKGYLTTAEAQSALAENVRIAPKNNAFLEQAPHFTEHVRRYLVDKYGEEKVLNQGLQVRTTCDLDLQRAAQQAVSEGVFGVDQRMGFRRDAIEHISGDEAIEAKRAEIEQEMRKRWALQQDAAGRIEEPEESVLEEGEVYTAVILEVKTKWVRVGIGDHEAILPMAWSDWVYAPNPKRSWRYTTATDLTAMIDTDGDRKPDASILQRGDVVTVKVEGLDTTVSDYSRTFKNTPGADTKMVAARLWQDPEVESALLSMDVDSGAIRVMVGGADFTKSQFNRAVQSRRQVGSTFKPLVYAAAIESKRVTTASIVADAPLAFSTSEEFVWKPANYGDDYLGNITLRKALAMSRNTCTVRVLEAMDPGMNDDVVYNFARRLGIGGPPLGQLGEDYVPKPENDLLCPWTLESRDSTICMDRFPPKDPDLSNTAHRRQLKDGEEYWCRTCDMSMGLGSASLTMEELVRAYSAFASGGKLVEPYYIEEVRDRNGTVLEQHRAPEFPQVMDSEVASITSWLLQGVVSGGTGSVASRELGLVGLGGKTGTTNDFKDAWFVGFTNDVITASWVGYDQPRSLGVSSTGGRTALPIWIDYMRLAAPKEQDRPFPMRGDIEWAQIDEENGRRVSSGGRSYPFIGGTVPESSGAMAGQVSIQDATTEL